MTALYHIRKFAARFPLALALGVMLAASIHGQSVSQDFPTPITANDISGIIKARDIGDSRLTTYYYALNGEQGDLFVNLVTRNFTGDIDIFTVNGLRPITKIVVYADYNESETGRAIYLRKPERLLLRVQGRSPNDDEASFRLKFAGSFVAMRSEDVPTGPEMPKVSQETVGSVRVNAVGTILPSPPKSVVDAPAGAKQEAKIPSAEPPQIEASAEVELAETIEGKQNTSDEPVAEEKMTDARVAGRRSSRRPPATRSTSPAVTPKKETAVMSPDEKPTEERPTTKKEAEEAGFRTLTGNRRAKADKGPVETRADPLASINLVIQFKDGNILERKMSEVTRFSVDKGVLVVVLKTGGTTRYPIVEVAKVTIE